MLADTDNVPILSYIPTEITSIFRPVCCSQLPRMDGLGGGRLAGGFKKRRMKLLEGKTTNNEHFGSSGVGKLTTIRTIRTEPLALHANID